MCLKRKKKAEMYVNTQTDAFDPGCPLSLVLQVVLFPQAALVSSMDHVFTEGKEGCLGFQASCIPVPRVAEQTGLGLLACSLSHRLLAHSRSSPTWRSQKSLAFGVKAFTAPPLC